MNRAPAVWTQTQWKVFEGGLGKRVVQTLYIVRYILMALMVMAMAEWRGIEQRALQTMRFAGMDLLHCT